MVLKDKILYKNEILTQSLEYRYEDITKNYPIGAFDKQAVMDFIKQIDMVSLIAMVSPLFTSNWLFAKDTSCILFSK